MSAKRLLVLSTLLLSLVALPARAEMPPAAQVDRETTHWSDLLNTYYGLGCATGTAAGTAVGFSVLQFSSFVFSYAIIGCSLGLLAGPLGLLAHDAITGDDAVNRYAEDVGWGFRWP